MFKNKILIIVLFGILLVCCIGLGVIIAYDKQVDAQINNEVLLLTCESDTIKVNEEITCTLSGNVMEYEVSAVSSTIEKNLNYDLIKVIPHSSWEGDGEMGDVDLYTAVNKSKKFDILTFNIKLVDDTTNEININIANNSFFDENYEEHKLENVTKTLKVGK